MSDLISRSWLLGVFELVPWDTEKDRNRAIHHVRELAPSAQPEEASVILGTSKDGVRLWYKCSVCGEPANADDNYCCNCGRKFING